MSQSQSTKVLWGSHDLGFCKGNGIPDLITLFYPIMIPPSLLQLPPTTSPERTGPPNQHPKTLDAPIDDDL